MYGRAAMIGAAAGVLGAGVMTAFEKFEQGFTKRPNSYVPAHTLERLLALPVRPDDERLFLNWAMHYGTGAAVGALRGVMSAAGLRGSRASLLHSAVRFTTDQTLENATGVGAPPWTWPTNEKVVDTVHKVIYSLATGLIADRLVPEAPKPG